MKKLYFIIVTIFTISQSVGQTPKQIFDYNANLYQTDPQFKKVVDELIQIPLSKDTRTCLKFADSYKDLTYGYVKKKAIITDEFGQVISEGSPIYDSDLMTFRYGTVEGKFYQNVCDHDVYVRSIYYGGNLEFRNSSYVIPKGKYHKFVELDNVGYWKKLDFNYGEGISFHSDVTLFKGIANASTLTQTKTQTANPTNKNLSKPDKIINSNPQSNIQNELKTQSTNKTSISPITPSNNTKPLNNDDSENKNNGFAEALAKAIAKSINDEQILINQVREQINLKINVLNKTSSDWLKWYKNEDKKLLKNRTRVKDYYNYYKADKDKISDYWEIKYFIENKKIIADSRFKSIEEYDCSIRLDNSSVDELGKLIIAESRINPDSFTIIFGSNFNALNWTTDAWILEGKKQGNQIRAILPTNDNQYIYLESMPDGFTGIFGVEKYFSKGKFNYGNGTREYDLKRLNGKLSTRKAR